MSELGRRRQGLGIGGRFAVIGKKAEEAQEPEDILGNSGFGIADETNPSRPQILNAAEGIMHRAIGGQRKRIYGQIAPRRILHPIIGEGHVGPAAKGLHIEAQGGDLEMLVVNHRRHGAVFDARGDRLNARLGEQFHHPFGRFMGGNIDILDGNIEEQIPHAAADKARLTAV